MLGPLAAGKSTLCMRLAALFDLPLVSQNALLASALQDCSSRAGECGTISRARDLGLRWLLCLIRVSVCQALVREGTFRRWEDACLHAGPAGCPMCGATSALPGRTEPVLCL